jgi:hypothetical protein
LRHDLVAGEEIIALQASKRQRFILDLMRLLCALSSFAVACRSAAIMPLLCNVLIVHTEGCIMSTRGVGLACGVFLAGIGGMTMGSAFGVEENWSKRVVLEAKPGDFEASWIDAGPGLHSDAAGQAFYVRKTFHSDHPEQFRRVYVSGDSQYVLWVNGREAARGPARFDPGHQVYDTLDISDLVVAGDNVITALVMYWGMETSTIPYFQCSARPAFLFESPELKSDASWKVLISPAHAFAGKKNCRAGGAAFWYERVDGHRAPQGAERLDFDDSRWKPARALCDIEKQDANKDTSTPWKVTPRRIPAPEVRALESCRPIQAGAVNGAAKEPPFAFSVAPDAAASSDFPVVLPADGNTHYVVFDAGRLVNGFVSVEMEGADADTLEVMYAEAPSLDRDKGRRDALENRRIEGSSDVYVLRDGAQTYEPFLHRTFRFIRLAARPTKPLTIHGLHYRWTGYPFAENGHFACSDERLNKIWQVGWYTQRMCAFDTFEDCPYYERMQYGGDTRIQGLVTLYASGDTLLLANAIRQLQASSIPEGLVQSRYPNHVFQVIPGYSLCWIQMLDDYYRHTGDLTLVRECAHTVASILMFYEQHRTEQGFIANLPYWNFYDWTFEHSGVPDAHKENCTLSTMHYKGALDIAARLFGALGDTALADRFRKQSAELAQTINARAWDDAAGLYTDGIATRSFSQHVNVFAVLFGLADETRKGRIAGRLFTDKTLRGTTFYFAHYLHEAAVALGKADYVFNDLARWQGMLDLGATTWWETPNEPRSECHAWSATPTYRLMTTVLGVLPVEPGFKKARIAPYCAGLDWAEGSVPTPHGPIAVRWDRKDTFAMDVTIPDGVEAEVVLPNGEKHTVQAGKHHFVAAK